MITQTPHTKQLLTPAAIAAQQERLARAKLDAEQYWSHMSPPVDAAALVALRRQFENYVKPGDYFAHLEGHGPTIDYQHDQRYNRLKNLYAGEYLRMTFNRVSAYTDVSAYDLDMVARYGACLKDWMMTALIQKPATEFQEASIDALAQKLADNDKLRYLPHPTSGSIDYEQLLERIQAALPGKLDMSVLSGSGALRHFHNDVYGMLMDKIVGRENSFERTPLTSAIRSIFAPRPHASAADGEIKEEAQTLVRKTIGRMRLGMPEEEAYEMLLAELPDSFRAWDAVSAELMAKPELKPIRTHAAPINRQEPGEPFSAKTLACFVNEECGVQVPTEAELAAMYHNRHIATIEPVVPTEAQRTRRTDELAARRKLGLDTRLAAMRDPKAR